MYFSDVVNLVGITYSQDALLQYVEAETSREVFCDLGSVTGSESSNAGQNGIRASARAVVHTEDYSGETIVDYAGGSVLPAGRYGVYRTYVNGDTVELYLEAKAGETA